MLCHAVGRLLRGQLRFRGLGFRVIGFWVWGGQLRFRGLGFRVQGFRLGEPVTIFLLEACMPRFSFNSINADAGGG